jgi:hypothetical protein
VRDLSQMLKANLKASVRRMREYPHPAIQRDRIAKWTRSALENP